MKTRLRPQDSVSGARRTPELGPSVGRAWRHGSRLARDRMELAKLEAAAQARRAALRAGTTGLAAAMAGVAWIASILAWMTWQAVPWTTAERAIAVAALHGVLTLVLLGVARAMADAEGESNDGR